MTGAGPEESGEEVHAAGRISAVDIASGPV
jgi:hypothetical protein